MVRIQAATGMRPSEVCKMRPCDIDKSRQDAWIYRLENHKTAHHGIVKAVPIVGDARLALEPYLNRASNAYCFSPAEAAQWRLQQRSETRTTPLKYDNRPGTNKKENPKRQAGECYTKDSYRRAIVRNPM
jgi:integrase